MKSSPPKSSQRGDTSARHTRYAPEALTPAIAVTVKNSNPQDKYVFRTPQFLAPRLIASLPNTTQQNTIKTGIGMKRSPVTNGYAMAGGNVLMLTTVPITSGKVDALALYDMAAIMKNPTIALV